MSNHLHLGNGRMYLTLTALRKRGWTETLVVRFLGKPDKIRPNPHCRRGAPMKLFLSDRVYATESTSAFQAAMSAAEIRKDAAAKGNATKAERLMTYVEGVVIEEVPVLDRDELIRRSCASYNRHQMDLAIDRGWSDYREADLDSDPAFLNRITVNFLRHKLTPYERELEAIARKVGIGAVYLALRVKVFAAIVAVYPWLKDECCRQVDRGQRIPDPTTAWNFCRSRISAAVSSVSTKIHG